MIHCLFPSCRVSLPLAGLCLVGLAVAGCASSPAPGQPRGSTATTQATSAADPTRTDALPADAAATATPPATPPATPAPAAPVDAFTINAMIGQINGKPLYASTVLAPLEGQLRAWSSTLSPRDFRMATTRLVGNRLYQIVFDTLFLGEAQRQLTEQERFGLKINLRMNRQELVRRYGAGSEPLADEEMRKKTGKGLEETLDGIRQAILIRKYQNDVIMPKITVSRRDVERYYNEPANYEKYNPKPGRKIRIIRVGTNAQASDVERQLAEGKAFAEVAAVRFNQFNREGGGLMTIKDAKENTIEFVQGDKVFGIEPLNEALLKLKAGQASPRITTGTGRDELHWWVFVEAISEGKHIPLREAQLQIEQQIRGMQYLMLEQRYRKKLFEDAGFDIDLSSENPLGNTDMNKALVEIAITVYGPQAKP